MEFEKGGIHTNTRARAHTHTVLHNPKHTSLSLSQRLHQRKGRKSMVFLFKKKKRRERFWFSSSLLCIFLLPHIFSMFSSLKIPHASPSSFLFLPQTNQPSSPNVFLIFSLDPLFLTLLRLPSSLSTYKNSTSYHHIPSIT